jgi:hypothetical protein
VAIVWQSCGSPVAIEWQSNNTGDGHYMQPLPRSPKQPGKWLASCPEGRVREHWPEICSTCFRHKLPIRWQARVRELQGAESHHHHAFVLHLHVRCSPSPSTQIVIYAELHLPPSSMCPPFASPLFEIHDRSVDQTRRQSEGSPPQADKILISCLLLTCRPSLLLVRECL